MVKSQKPTLEKLQKTYYYECAEEGPKNFKRVTKIDVLMVGAVQK